MPDPTVACIMLTRDRPEYARRAVECFRAQTYQQKRMLILNSGAAPILSEEENGADGIEEPCFVGADAMTIGALRNLGCKYAAHHYVESWTRPEIFLHLDDDDYSHPNRIAEQVALLQSSGADCVGYREVLFWQEADVPHPLGSEPDTWDGTQAYLYVNNDPRYCIGSSFCYWRKAWEARPFEDVMREEDGRWLKGVRSVGVSANHGVRVIGEGRVPHDWREKISPTFHPSYACDPRMICRVHAGNANHYPLDELVQTCPSSWCRVPQWDTHCREVMG